MKNIHVLPTDKPSRIYSYKGNLFLTTESHLHSPSMEYQNIYITNSEEIKEGDYVVQINFEKTNTQVIKCETEFQTKIANSKDGSFSKNKIILTTDQDLIKNGVQAIDDEFLEWFVNNPSCDFVEIKLLDAEEKLWEEYYKKNSIYPKYPWYYKIIIPKEEPNSTGNIAIDYQIGKSKAIQNSMLIDAETAYNSLPKEEPKQETLEEAINQELENHFFSNNSEIKQAEYFINFGAKWQQEQERMYSDKEVKHLMTLAFEQGFKKADVVEAGLEAKETDTEVNWIFLKHKK